MYSRKAVFALLAAMFAALLVAVPAAQAQQAPHDHRNVSDNLKHPLGARRAALKQEAVSAKIRGENVGRVYRVNGEYVETITPDEDTIWTVLGEFGDQTHPATGGSAGPLHNQIPEPDRAVDNSTIWRADFNRKSYKKLLFAKNQNANSMRNFYLEQSGGLYTVNGKVSDWVMVPYNEALYGNNLCGDIVCPEVWFFVDHSLAAWYDSQVAAGKSGDDINDYLSKFDVWDRYDYDSDGNFDEPDGYIDHFQSVHAGEGEETGGGAQGESAIWSHRWYVQLTGIGDGGPTVNGVEVPFGGTQIGDSAYWVGDYTIEPENGGLGVFAHEYAHDLDLPDLYDTSGNTGGAENSTGFWTLMSSGSYGNTGEPEEGIGSTPIHMSAYEKLFLGWTDYKVATFGWDRSYHLNPAEFDGDQFQTLIIPLPPKDVTRVIGEPYAGDFYYYSDQGNNLDNSMVRSVTLPAGDVTLAAKVNYEIEEDWDYAYVLVNGSPVETNLSTDTDPNGQNDGHGITGSSGGNWVDLTADLSDFAGQTVDLGFRYWTDVAVAENGIRIDDVMVTGLPADGGETEPGWDYDGFFRTTGEITTTHDHAYFIENRRYQGYDKSLKTGPYNFGYTDDPNTSNLVEHFPYENGMLVWYYDESFEDNSVGDHCADGRCGGFYLPVDAHPDLLIRPDGDVWRARVQSYDSTFGLNPTDAICLHLESAEVCHPSLKKVPQFYDVKDYWFPPDPSINHMGWHGVPVPKTGTKVRVVSEDKDGTIKIDVSFEQP
jgi:immune inhibitor A